MITLESSWNLSVDVWRSLYQDLAERIPAMCGDVCTCAIVTGKQHVRRSLFRGLRLIVRFPLQTHEALHTLAELGTMVHLRDYRKRRSAVERARREELRMD